MAKRIRLALVAALMAGIALASPVVAAAAQVDVLVMDSETEQPLQNAEVKLHRVAPSFLTLGPQYTNASGYTGFTNPAIFPGTQFYVRVNGPAGMHVEHVTDDFPYNGMDRDVQVDLWQKAHRVWGPDRYTTAVQTARDSFGIQGLNRWPNIPDVVIASGEDYAAADPLTAAGICWCYDAPLLLVGRDHTPTSVKQAVAELVAATGHVTIHVVGGPNSVPNARYQDLVDYVGDPSKLTLDRITPYADRFELASSVAARMQLVAATTAKTMEDIVLVANGADPDKFFDALALSPITAHNGTPILLVGKDYVPSHTRNRISALGFSRTIVGGGPATVSWNTYAELGATDRWWGDDRYETAVEIASMAATETLLGTSKVGVAAKLPDALTGGAAQGLMYGPLVLTQTEKVPGVTYAFVESCG
jgi:putative cell wall-binding protein